MGSNSASPRLLHYSINQQVLRPVHPLVVGHTQLTQRPIAIIEATWDDGMQTSAELSPLPGLSRESLQESIKAAHFHLQALIQSGHLETQAPCPPSTRLALDWLRLARAPGEWSRAPTHQLLTLGQDRPIKDVVKVKIGRHSAAREISELQDLLQQYPGLRLRLDANQALDVTTLRQYVQAIDSSCIDYWEEPLKMDEWALAPDWTRTLPVAFDESILQSTQEGIHPHFPVRPKNIILRPTLCHGIEAALSLIHWASTQNIGVTITSSYEGPVGMRALAWLASRVYSLNGGLCGTDTLGLFAQADEIPQG